MVALKVIGRPDCDLMIGILMVHINVNLLMALDYLYKVQNPDLVLDEMGSFGIKWIHSALP